MRRLRLDDDGISKAEEDEESERDRCVSFGRKLQKISTSSRGLVRNHSLKKPGPSVPYVDQTRDRNPMSSADRSSIDANETIDHFSATAPLRYI